MTDVEINELADAVDALNKMAARVAGIEILLVGMMSESGTATELRDRVLEALRPFDSDDRVQGAIDHVNHLHELATSLPRGHSAVQEDR